MAVEIRVSAVAFRDQTGRVLLVRKRGTSSWMNPGGKPEPGETPRQCAVREIAEELGLLLDPERLIELGDFEAPAANEADAVVKADVFTWPEVLRADPIPAAEIADLRWVSEDDLDAPDLAPLFVQHIAPHLGWVRATDPS